MLTAVLARSLLSRLGSRACLSQPVSGTLLGNLSQTSSSDDVLHQNNPTLLHMPHAHGLAAWGHARREMSGSARFTDDYDRHHRINAGIQKKHLKVIFPDGRTELMARKEALKAAAELKLDLVEFKTPENATGPAVAKITNYKTLRTQHADERRREIKRGHELKSAVSTATTRGSGVGSGKAAGKSMPSKAEATGKGLKAKEVFFSPKIAANDIEVRIKKIRQWLESGNKVHVSREVDAKDSDNAAILAIDSLITKVADVGRPDKKKHITPTMVSITLLPLDAQAAGQPGKKQH